MEIFTFVKWVLKQYTLRIVLLALVILLVQVYTDSLTPTKDYILKIISRDDRAQEIDSLSSDVKNPSIFQAITRSAPTTVAVTTTTTAVPSTSTTTTQTTTSTAQPHKPSTLPPESNQDAQPHIKIFDLNNKLEPAEIYDKIQCRKSIEVFVSTTLCVHDLFRDVHVSGAIMRDGVWERHIVGEYQKAMYGKITQVQLAWRFLSFKFPTWTSFSQIQIC